MKVLLLCILVSAASAAPPGQSMTVLDDGSYRFHYETGEEGGSHSRTEVRHPDGSVEGRFSYQDPDGDLREVKYRADDTGFVAVGDVGVKGAPKGQFPAVQDQQQEANSKDTPPAQDQPSQAGQDKNEINTHVLEELSSESDPDDHDDKDEMQDLTLEDSSENAPPEAFPPGFFLEKFQGLRRLPEPTKEAAPATTESPKDSTSEPKPEDAGSSAGETQPEELEKEKNVGTAVFRPLRPFSSLSPQEWASALFHQPVYVFSYHQPPSYGYQYFF